jgi:hypothetical protein
MVLKIELDLRAWTTYICDFLHVGQGAQKERLRSLADIEGIPAGRQGLVKLFQNRQYFSF